MMPYSGATPRTPAVVCRRPYAIGIDCMYSGLMNLIDPSSFNASTSACFSMMRRPDRSPPACMLVCPLPTSTVPCENALRKPYMIAR